jgi:S1-C subfamily serine protease
MASKKTALRTTLPFEGGLSPTTEKSRGVPLFGNTPSLQDLLNGEENKNDIHARGSWGEGEEEHNYHEEGSEYRLDEQLRKLDKARAIGEKEQERWVAETNDGTQYEFSSKEEAEKQLAIIQKPVKRLFKKKAANTDFVARVVEGCVGVSVRQSNGKGGVGAAFCVGKDKFLTCAHVIMSYGIGVDKDFSKFMDKSLYIELSRKDLKAPAKVIAVDPDKDIALLECQLESEILELSDSKSHKVGEDVVVIGSPKGFENTVSEGIVGGLDRVVFTHDGAALHVFTDAKILPGNSGGPMISTKDGTVIGMIEIIVGGNSTYGLNAAIESEYFSPFVTGT